VRAVCCLHKCDLPPNLERPCTAALRRWHIGNLPALYSSAGSASGFRELLPPASHSAHSGNSGGIKFQLVGAFPSEASTASPAQYLSTAI
jgi:hypothetical protein